MASEYSDIIHSEGFIGFFDGEQLMRNVTNFLHEQIYQVFHHHDDTEKQIFTNNFKHESELSSLLEHLVYLVENYSIWEILAKIPEFIWTCTRESFSNESGSNAVIACFFFVSFAVMVHLVLIRPLVNYLFRIKLEEHLNQALKEENQDVAISEENTDHLKLIKLDKRFVDISNRVFRKEDDKNLTRKIIEVAHYLVTVMMILIYIPYTNMEGYWVWMCFWSYCLCSLVVFTTTVKKFRWLRRISWFYFFFPAQGLTIVANFAYLYYGLATWSFGYVFVHFVPILFMWFVLILNIREFIDEKLNFTTSSRFWNGYHLMFYLIIVTYWRFVFNPNVIYSRIILDVFLWACFLPFSINSVSFVVVSWLRKRWFDRYGPTVIRQIILASNRKRN